MPKALCIFAAIIAVLLLIIFGLDLAMGFPFGGQNSLMDIGFAVSAAILAYLSWTAFREQR